MRYQDIAVAAVFGLLVNAILLFIVAYPFQLLWNGSLVAAVTWAKEITHMQAFGILLMVLVAKTGAQFSFNTKD